jgi:hypothetical protein
MDVEASVWHRLSRASGSCYGGGAGAVIGEGMNLYCWNYLWDVRYGANALYVAASSVEEARQKALSAKVSEYGSEPNRKISERELNSIKEAIRSEPRLILSGAEIYEWSE